MIKLVDKMLFDIVGVVLIVFAIKLSYLKRYTKCANNYIKNQLNLLVVSSIICIFSLNVYYYLENTLKIDALYLNGIVLAIFLGMGGILINKLYNKYFKVEESDYYPKDGEYLFIIMVSFISITVKMFFDGIIGISIPVAILLGRLLWLDTKDLHSINEALKVDHDRIRESSIIFVMGMLLISACMHFLGERYYFIVLISLIYGLIIYFPYCYVISKIDKKG